MDSTINKTNDKISFRLISSSWLTSIFGWYDFFAYTVFAANLKEHFFKTLPNDTANLFAIILFLIGFFVRPIGAIFFGYIGDKVGRKYSFLLSVVLLGFATFAVGCLPGTETLGITAAYILIALRLIQGFAIGGECSAIYTYLSETVPASRRGLYAGLIQGAAALGWGLCIVTSQILKNYYPELLADWGWRIPFLTSIPFLLCSIWLRLSMKETPIFMKLKLRGKLSPAPLLEIFTRPVFLWRMFLGVGLVIAHATAWYTSHIYSFNFLTQSMRVDAKEAAWLLIGAIVLASPTYYIFGILSDKIGRKKVILTSCVVFGCGIFTAFNGLAHYSNPKLEMLAETMPISVRADANECNLTIDFLGTKKYETACDNLRVYLVKRGFSYHFVPDYPGTKTKVSIGTTVLEGFNPETLEKAIINAGYPAKTEKPKPNYIGLFLILFLLTFCVGGFCSSPAFLSELFPARVRALGVAIPYNIANGWFGGLLPILALTLSVANGDIFSGLWYGIVLWVISFLIIALFIPETAGLDFSDEVNVESP